MDTWISPLQPFEGLDVSCHDIEDLAFFDPVKDYCSCSPDQWFCISIGAACFIHDLDATHADTIKRLYKRIWFLAMSNQRLAKNINRLLKRGGITWYKRWPVARAYCAGLNIGNPWYRLVNKIKGK